MDIKNIDKSKEYTFLEVWEMCLENSDVFITSKSSGNSYRIEKIGKKKKLKFYNPVICGWQVCGYIVPEEIFDMWSIDS